MRLHAGADALGKAEGYPLCARPQRDEARCLIGMVSRLDEVFTVATR